MLIKSSVIGRVLSLCLIFLSFIGESQLKIFPLSQNAEKIHPTNVWQLHSFESARLLSKSRKQRLRDNDMRGSVVLFNERDDISDVPKHRTELKLHYNHLTPFNPSDTFLIYTPIASSRSNSPYLQRPTKTSNKLLHALFYRQVEAWNSLPPALKSASSLPSFKGGLKNIDLPKFLKASLISL
jgi:hypothetical protein